MEDKMKKIARISLPLVLFTSVIIQGTAGFVSANQDPGQTVNRPLTYKGLKISIIGIKREKEFCYTETASNLPCIPFDDKVRAKAGEDLVLAYVKFERLPEFQDKKLSISHYSLSDTEGKEYSGMFENKTAEPFSKEVTLGFVCSIPEGATRPMRLKLIFGHPESLGEVVLDLEKIKVQRK
jgi:hypothetical protein